MGGAIARPSNRENRSAWREGRPIRLMLVDDSTVARAVLTRMLNADPEVEVTAVAGTAEEALDALSHVRVDVIILDLEMPGQGGLKSIPAIIRAARGAQILIVSSLAEEGAEATISALAQGAADTLPKPGAGRFYGQFSSVLIQKVKELGRGGMLAPRAAPEPAPPMALRPDAVERMSILAIGASTGGIHALGAFFTALPDRIDVPILVTQHLPPPFMAVFARQLGVLAKRPAMVAEQGMILHADTIYVAPGDAHLTVERLGNHLQARLISGRAASGCLPSVDPMFESLASIAGGAGLGIVLTGMGRDGLQGARAMIAQGGSIYAQDQASSAVWGMPKAIAEAGLASAILPPERLARLVAEKTVEARCK